MILTQETVLTAVQLQPAGADTEKLPVALAFE